MLVVYLIMRSIVFFRKRTRKVFYRSFIPVFRHKKKHNRIIRVKAIIDPEYIPFPVIIERTNKPAPITNIFL